MEAPPGPRVASNLTAGHVTTPAPAPRYCPDYPSWDLVARALLAAPLAGLDTEFHGVEFGKQSCAGNALVHVWSVALPTGQKSPRGYTRALSRVLPSQALNHPGLRAWLTSADHAKVAHNMNVDVHAIENTSGMLVAGVQDSLALARWRWPDRVAGGGGYDLKTLARDVLGRRPVGEFDELFSRPRVVTRTRTVRGSDCACAVPGCRLRRQGHEKTKWERCEEYPVELKTTEMIPLPEIVPGHEKWETLVKYAGEDAEWALELHDLMRALPDKRPMPW